MGTGEISPLLPIRDILLSVSYGRSMDYQLIGYWPKPLIPFYPSIDPLAGVERGDMVYVFRIQRSADAKRVYIPRKDITAPDLSKLSRFDRWKAAIEQEREQERIRHEIQIHGGLRWEAPTVPIVDSANLQAVRDARREQETKDEDRRQRRMLWAKMKGVQ